MSTSGTPQEPFSRAGRRSLSDLLRHWWLRLLALLMIERHWRGHRVLRHAPKRELGDSMAANRREPIGFDYSNDPREDDDDFGGDAA